MLRCCEISSDYETSIEGSHNTSLVRGDGTLIEEVFVNLFQNAFQAMVNAQEKRLHVIIQEIPEKRVAVRISDSGCGIPEENRIRIFEPFFTTQQGRGMGLGLYFSKQVVEKQGGSITFESEVGRGTTFTILLPIASDDRTDAFSGST